MFIFSSQVFAEVGKRVTCYPGVDLQSCIDSVDAGVIFLKPAKYETDGIMLHSNLTFILPKGAVIRFSDTAKLNSQAYGGVVNAVILAKGSQEAPLENIHLIIDGEVDGNKQKHPYEKGGAEAINLAWIKNSSLRGEGTIHSANADGIDVDAAENLVIEGVTVKHNGGSGIHFGSPRPIIGSKDNVVINVKSYENGFERKRSGLDVSWPNPFGATFINSVAKDNYRNFEMEAFGGFVVNCLSLSSGKVIEEDDYSGASYVFVNGEDLTNQDWISKKTIILFTRDVKKILGIKYPKFLDGVDY